MEFNIEIRRKQLENLDQFISSSKDRVDSILDYLGWNAQKIAENQKEMVKCMINPLHRIPASSASSHMQSCAWRKEMYDDNDLPLSEPNPIPGSTIVIDDMAKVNVLNNALVANPHMKTGWRSTEPVPKTSNRLTSTFSSDERLALYDYTIASTKGPPQVPEFNIEPKIEEKHNLTPRELEALERDAKRRRIKYKSKSVHTNRKSATEVLREIIDGQMEQYEEWLNEQDDTTTNSNVKQEKNDSPIEPMSPRSSRSPNSYKSEESRHRNNRNHSRERTRDRSRSSSRKRDRYSRYDSRNDRKNDYSRRKYEDREYEKRKYEERDFDKRKYEEKDDKRKYEEKDYDKRKYEEKDYDKRKYEEKDEKRKYEEKEYDKRKYESRDPRRRRRSSSTHSRTKSDY